MPRIRVEGIRGWNRLLADAFPNSQATGARVRVASLLAPVLLLAPLVASVPLSSGDPKQTTSEKIVPDAPAATSDDPSGGLTPAEREQLLKRFQEKRERDAESAKAAPPAKEPAEKTPPPPETTVN
jgi:hypothetical protein